MGVAPDGYIDWTAPRTPPARSGLLGAGTVVLYPDASHAVGSEKSKAISREIHEFLNAN